MIILSTDTAHHRYFINRLLKEGFSVNSIYFETGHKSGIPFYDEEQDEFEKHNFFVDVPYDLPDNMPIHEVSSVNKITIPDMDLGIVFGTGIIREHIIGRFNNLLNIHRGISNLYRGLDSDLWAIHCEDYNNIGVTIHEVAPTLDTGDIAAQKTLKLTKDMEIWQIRYYTTVLATDMMIDVLRHNPKRIPQAKGKYFSSMPHEMKIETKKKFDKYVESICSE